MLNRNLLIVTAIALAAGWGLACPVGPAQAGNFASDFASCAKGPIDAASFAFEDGKTAAQFAINHGECVPPVVGGDPLLYGMSGLVGGLQNAGNPPPLPHGTQACIDASLGQASRPVASVLDTVLSKTGLNSMLPSEGRTMLKDIAAGESQASLYQVPGVGQVMQHVSCSCAVASTALDINKLKDRLTSVVKSVEGCKGVVTNLLGGAYGVGAEAAAAAGNAAKGAYNAAKDAINSVGCSFGLGGCGKKGPPFFCTGFKSLRASGVDLGSIKAMFPSAFIPADYVERESNQCEQSWAADLAAAAQKVLDDQEKKRMVDEVEKAEKLGAANSLGFAFRWMPKCSDKPCEKSIAAFADLYTKDAQDPETLAYYKSFGVVVIALNKKYGALAEVAVALSKDRHHKALRENANAPVAERLPAFGCKLFLGRARQSRCAAAAGFQVCKDYALKGEWDLCIRGGTPGMFAAGNGLENVLRSAGCIPRQISAPQFETRGRPASGMRGARRASVQAQCLSPNARVTCDALSRGGSNVQCEGPLMLTLDRARLLPPVRRVPPAVQQTQPPPLRPMQPTRPVQPVAATSTLCRFTSGPRAGQVQDYAPMAPIPVGSPCQDARGSYGVVVSP